MFKKIASSFAEHVLSIPIFLKIMGIGVLVAVFFGGVLLYQTHRSTSRILSHLLEQNILTTTDILGNAVEQSLISGDIPSVVRHLDYARQTYPDIQYIVVWGPDKHIIASTSKTGDPAGLIPESLPPCPPDCGIHRFEDSEDTIFVARSPILGGDGGVIQVGFIDRSIAREHGNSTRTVLWGLAVCIAIGTCLALLLTHFLTRPIHNLVEAANRIREGEFETRASVFSNDEIGRLAAAFNQMAEALQKYKQEVSLKEKSRVSLIEKTVQAQEEERKSISRELHDHLGQSLLAVLLQVQSGHNHSELPASLCRDIEKSIRQIIEEVHRLAWGMRPSILDDYGLDSALARHIEETCKHTGLDIDYNFTSSPGLEKCPFSGSRRRRLPISRNIPGPAMQALLFSSSFMMLRFSSRTTDRDSILQS